jgi:hypothetical protein
MHRVHYLVRGHFRPPRVPHCPNYRPASSSAKGGPRRRGTFREDDKMLLRWERSGVREEIRFAKIVWRRPLAICLISGFDRFVINLRHPIYLLRLARDARHPAPISDYPHADSDRLCVAIQYAAFPAQRALPRLSVRCGLCLLVGFHVVLAISLCGSDCSGTRLVDPLKASARLGQTEGCWRGPLDEQALPSRRHRPIASLAPAQAQLKPTVGEQIDVVDSHAGMMGCRSSVAWQVPVRGTVHCNLSAR